MGINNFTQLIKKFAPDAIEKKEYSQFVGETWAIDASIYFYKFSYNQQSKKPNSHIDGFYQLILRLYKHGIRPIIVLDGKTPIEKLHTLKKRKQNKQKNIAKIQKLHDELICLVGESPSEGDLPIELQAKLEEINQAEKNVIHFKVNVEQDIDTLCDLLDVPILIAKGEADALCAKLYLQGIVQGILSEDSDILLYNGGRLIRKFNWSNEVEMIDLNRLLQKLKINYDQFVDLCILCGTDYTVDTIYGIGVVSAYELIQSGLSIEEIIAKIEMSKTSDDINLKAFQKYHLPTQLEDFNYQGARDLVKNAPQNEKQIGNLNQFNAEKIKINQLKQYMSEKCKYMEKTIANHYLQMVNGQKLPDCPKKEKIKLQLKPCSQDQLVTTKIKLNLKVSTIV